jgi:hypothetical protein
LLPEGNGPPCRLAAVYFGRWNIAELNVIGLLNVIMLSLGGVGARGRCRNRPELSIDNCHHDGTFTPAINGLGYELPKFKPVLDYAEVSGINDRDEETSCLVR